MLSSIQILRALAAWVVVGHHVVQLYPGMRTVNEVATVFTAYGAFGVDLFFVISGFVIYTSTTDKEIPPWLFMLHRIARVVPAYWLFTLLTAAILLFNETFLPITQLDGRLLLKSLFFIPAENRSGVGIFPLLTVGWTLNFEIAFYAIYAVSLLFPFAVRLSITAAGIALLLSVVPKLGGSMRFYSNPIVFEFLFGIAVGIVYRRGWLENIRPWIATLLAFSAISFVVAHAKSHDLLLVGAPCTVIVLATVALESRLTRFVRLAHLGDWSYATYLSHLLPLGAAITIGKALNLSPSVTIPVAIIVIAFVSWVCHTQFELPLQNAIRKLVPRSVKPNLSA